MSKKLSIVAFLCATLVAGSAIAENPSVTFVTTSGTMVIELYADEAPLSVENFLTYVRDGYYDGTIFHRVIPGFMIQGGGFTNTLNKKETRDPIENEAKNGLTNDRGTLSMARTSDPHSATSQFFINSVDNESLNQPPGGGWGYAVFGKVTSGIDVIDVISAVKTVTKAGGLANCPVDNIIITKATVN